MALIFDGSRCAICEELLGNRAYLETSDVFFEEHDPLWRFCDAPLHWDCYEHWPERRRFARQYVGSHVKSLAENPYWGVALLTDVVALAVRKKEPGQARLWLFETGTPVEVLLGDWSTWLRDLTLGEVELHRLEVANVRKALPDLRGRFPSLVRSHCSWRSTGMPRTGWQRRWQRQSNRSAVPSWMRSKPTTTHAVGSSCRAIGSA
jgi:hypothetical protein